MSPVDAAFTRALRFGVSGAAADDRRAAASTGVAGLMLFAVEVEKARTPGEILNRLHERIARPLGLNVYGIWRFPVDMDNLAEYQNQDVFAHESVPKEFWVEFWPMMRQQGPSVLCRMAWANPGLFTLTQAGRDLEPTGTQWWSFDLLKRHGMRDAAFSPVGRWIVGYWSKKVLQLSPDNRATLYAAAAYAVGRLEGLLGEKKRSLQTSPVLSPRELAVLRNYAAGKDQREIAAELSVGEGTVKTFFSRVQKKLKAKHRGHAVLLAMRKSLIR